MLQQHAEQNDPMLETLNPKAHCFSALVAKTLE